MERISQKEHVLVDYGPQRSFDSSPSDMEMDFNDVFGGPPRRFSVQEARTRHSFNDSMESEEDSGAVSRNSWNGFIEKPVFGEENANRRRNQGDFYDDIFKVDESYGSNPGSRVLSPVRPLSPKIEVFGTSLPAQFSLPAKLTKTTDLPTFASGSHSPHKKREKEMKNDAPGFYRQSPLSREGTVIGDDLRYTSEPDERDIGGDLKKSGESKEDSSSDYQFHFSIYKWAGKGVPTLVSLKGGKHFKPNEKIKIERCSISKGRMENDNTRSSSPLGGNANFSRDANFHSFSTRSRNLQSSDKENGTVGETLSVPKSKSMQSFKDDVGGDDSILRTEKEVEEPQFRQKTGLGDEIQTQIPGNSERTKKDKLRPLHALFVNEAEERGDVKVAQETERKSNMVKATQAAKTTVKVKENVKKIDTEAEKKLKKGDVEVGDDMQKRDSQAKRKGKRGLDKKTVVDTGVNRTSPPSSPIRSSENSTKAGIKGKVQDFVKMFSHEVHSTPQEGEISRSKSFKWKVSSNTGVEGEKSYSMPKANEKVQFPTINKTQDATPNVDKNLNKQEKTTKYSQTNTSTPQTKDYSEQKAAPSTNESRREDRKASVGSMDDLFGGNYVVEELFEDQDKASQTNGKSEDNQASDAKIKQWSQGRKGNIRSLLSTLQLVLWPDSGWKPVALMDLMEGNQVKRAYQRALLYIHPDKLQQKGAAAHHKYIAEKVFDILQEAWDHFNSLGPM